VPQAQKFQIIGCFARSEIGQGSNVALLETLAILKSDHFLLHSPNLNSTKWWIPGVGILATHALVVANLIVEGSSMGHATFIVPIRDLVSHKALPGIFVGECGPKMGFNSCDHGFLRFNYYLIPLSNIIGHDFSKKTPIQLKIIDSFATNGNFFGRLNNITSCILGNK
jgi:acyl-CoA oxidase